MMFSRFEKIMVALIMALLFAGVTLLVASAQDETPPPATEDQNCATCHQDHEMSWQNGPHGKASQDPIFTKAWTDQGKPAACLTCHVTGYDEATGTWKEDGVSCSACHTDTGGEHPKTTMSVDKNPNSCGTCHTDPRFGIKDWEGSTHYQLGMDCTTCHDPHNASLKVTVNLKNPTVNDASQLCVSCHKETSMKFPYSVHSQQGVTCIDCHLEHLEDPTDVHKVADHSFKASINTCNSCHAEQMHANGEAASTEASVGSAVPTPTSVMAASSDAPNITTSPAPVSPLGYAGITALIGIAAGMLLAPWLERGYRVVLKKSAEVHHDGK